MEIFETLTEPFGAVLGPIGQTIVIPAVAALVVAALVRLVGGSGRAALAAALGLGAAQLAIAWAIGGMPRLANPAAVDKLVLATLAFGPLADAMMRRGRLEPRAIIPLAALAPAVWIAWPVLVSLEPAGIGRAVLAIAAAFVLAQGIGRAEGRALSAIVAFIALGLAGIGIYGASYSMGQLFAGLGVGAAVAPAAVALAGGAAGGAGAALVGAPFRAAAAAGLASGTAILLLFTASLPIALVFLIPAVFAGDLAQRLPGAGTRGARHMAVITITIAALSAGAAIAVAMWHSGPLYLG